MKRDKCLPFFHPTRAVFVDDDRAFLDVLPLTLSSNLPYLRFDSPGELIEELASGRLQAELELDWWDSFPAEGSRRGQEQVVAFDKSLIYMRVFNRARFGLMSVLVADYQMPEMTGIELCRRLAHLPCKRILLTGQADRAVAVEAFNEGLIDLYLPKLHPRMNAELNLAIQRFQFEFLEQSTELITQMLQSEDPVVWGDPAFARFLNRICESNGIVEYYAVTDPKGYLLVTPLGNARLMLLFGESELSAQYQAAAISRAPEDVLERMRRRQSVLYFPSDDAECVLSPEQWRAACVALQPIPDYPERFYAMVDRPAHYMVSPETVLGLSGYVDLEN